MAHQQPIADVHLDKLCPPNKRTIFHLPQATDNNHDRFVPPPSFYDMIPFYKNHLGFTMELMTLLSFKTTGLQQPWQRAAIGRYSLLSSSFHIFDSLSKIHKDYHCHRRLSLPRECIGHLAPHMSPNPKVDAAESSVPTRSTMIHLCLPQLKSTRLTPPAPVLTVDKEDELSLKDTLHFIPKNDEHNIPGTRLEPMSNKESPEVEFTDLVIPVNVYEEEEKEDEITDEVYELKRREKGKNVEESRILASTTPIRSPRIHTDLVSSDTGKLQELMFEQHVPMVSAAVSDEGNKEVKCKDHKIEVIADLV
nr:hypothetical protein [Tanacetum cinerariifolium]